MVKSAVADVVCPAIASEHPEAGLYEYVAVGIELLHLNRTGAVLSPSINSLLDLCFENLGRLLGRLGVVLGIKPALSRRL